MVLRFGAGTNINAAFVLSGVRSLTVRTGKPELLSRALWVAVASRQGVQAV